MKSIKKWVWGLGFGGPESKQKFILQAHQHLVKHKWTRVLAGPRDAPKLKAADSLCGAGRRLKSSCSLQEDPGLNPMGAHLVYLRLWLKTLQNKSGTCLANFVQGLRTDFWTVQGLRTDFVQGLRTVQGLFVHGVSMSLFGLGHPNMETTLT